MKILITGAFGNIGLNTVKYMLFQGHEVSVFDIKSSLNSAKAEGMRRNLHNLFWGDIRNFEDITKAIKNQDAIIHLAAIIPPLSEKKPDFAFEVNVGGTENVIEAIKNSNDQPALVFSSSVSVHGNRQELKPPVSVNDPYNPSDHYSRHKIECEALIKRSNLKWTILRLGVVPPISVDMGIDPIMFDIGLDNRLEFVHTEDVALALSNAAELMVGTANSFSTVQSDEINGKTFLVGGGKKNGCQMHYRDFLGSILESIGIGSIKKEAFGANPYYTDWMDTEESEFYLHYQKHTFNDFILEMRHKFGPLRHLVKAISPIARYYLEQQSPYIKQK